MSFKLFVDTETPHWVEDVNHMLTTGTETPNCLEPEGCWCGLLVTSEECAWVDHAHHSPLLHLVFKNLSLQKPSGHSGFLALDAQTPCLTPAKNAALSFTTARCQCIGFATGGWADLCLETPPPPQGISSTRTKLVSLFTVCSHS